MGVSDGLRRTAILLAPFASIRHAIRGGVGMLRLSRALVIQEIELLVGDSIGQIGRSE